MRNRIAKDGLGHARDERVTSAAQAEFFRAEAARHRRTAEQERAFASLTGRGEHEARARHLEAWVSQAESVAAALERSGRGRH